MIAVNTITFCRNDYSADSEFWYDIQTCIRLLLNKGKYNVTMYNDEPGLGIIVIKYDYRDQMLCNAVPLWVNDELMEEINHAD